MFAPPSQPGSSSPPTPPDRWPEGWFRSVTETERPSHTVATVRPDSPLGSESEDPATLTMARRVDSTYGLDTPHRCCSARTAGVQLVASLLVTASVAGCEVASLPPTSSRSDGGPVVSRGVVSHEAKSQVRLYRDPTGCDAVQTVNRSFRVVTVRDADSGDGAPTSGLVGSRTQATPGADSRTRHLVLEETYDLRHCLASASVSSEATITAWAPVAGATEPLFRIRGRAMTGEVIGNLYRMTQRSCCGSNDVGSFYSLLTGRMLFSATGDPLALTQPDGSSRYLAVHDSYSAALPPEAVADSAVVGVLQWGGDRDPAARYPIVARPGGRFGLRALTLEALQAGDAGSTTAPSVTVGIARIEFVATTGDRDLEILIPIRAGDLDLDGATLPRGVALVRKP